MKPLGIRTTIMMITVLILSTEVVFQAAGVYGIAASTVESATDVQISSTMHGLSGDSAMEMGVAVSNPFSQDEASSAKDAGATWIRTDVGVSDRITQTYSVALGRGLSVIGIVSYWTVDNPDSFTLQDWENSIQEVQSAYPEIHVWEIWNEPTSTKYQHGYMDGTPQRYFDLIKSAYAILKANDPTAMILGIGGAQFGKDRDFDFTSSVFSLGGGAYMDALAVHAYPYELNVGKTWEYYEQLWQVELSRYKQFGKPLWLTETGSRSDMNNEADQAAYLKESYYFFKAAGIMTYIWYEMTDDAWGLLRSDLAVKQAYSEYLSIGSIESSPSLDLSVSPVSPSNGATITSNPVSATVQVYSNTPIQNAAVVIYVNDVSMCSGLTGADGYYSCSYVWTQTGATYLWRATASKEGYNAGTSQVWSFVVPSQTTLTLKSKTNQDAEFQGVQLKVDGALYSTPSSFAISPGTHRLSAPDKVDVDGLSYNFVRWEDEAGGTISTSQAFTYKFQSSMVLYAVYAAPTFTLTVSVKLAKANKPVSGASIFLDGQLIGKTDSKGKLAIKGLPLGAHILAVTMSGFADFQTSLQVENDMSYTVILTGT
jgi:hypothetical protein